MADNDDLNMSKLSLNSNDSQSEDWDRSLMLMDDSEPSSPTEAQQSRSRTIAATTPRNSVIFPGDRDSTPRSGPKPAAGDGKRSLSELLRLHSEKGTDVKFSTEEASRVAEVLGQWINASSSPYEGEDNFFARSQDDLSISSRRSPFPEGRPRGQSEGMNSRPPSSAGSIKT